MSTPLLSIIIPLHNGEATIDRCLQSVAEAAAGAEAEVVVVDDGSTDSSLLRVQQFAAAHPDLTIRSVHTAHRGVAAARNEALRVAAGQYVWPVDADDRVARGSVRQLCSTIAALQAEQPDLIKLGAMVRGAQAECDVSHGRMLDSPWPLLDARNGCLDHTTYIYRCGFVVEQGLGYPEGMSLLEDSVWVAEVLMAASRVLYLPNARCYELSPRRHSAWQRAERTRHVDDVVAFFAVLKRLCLSAPDACQCGAQRLYLRYRYLYARVLSVKGCAWSDVARLRKASRPPSSFFDQRTGLSERLLQNGVCHWIFTLACRMARPVVDRVRSWGSTEKEARL
ncbi:MAG: glycosyltransferase [Bacteroidales bacterium]|nr:glycosyltransferase [Bacteroidales bacterium]